MAGNKYLALRSNERMAGNKCVSKTQTRHTGVQLKLCATASPPFPMDNTYLLIMYSLAVTAP